MKRPTKFFLHLFGWLFTLGFSLLLVGCIAGVFLFKHYTRDLPDYSTLEKYDPPTVTRLYASDGRLMAEYATEKRVFVPLPAMPKRVIGAFLAAEDKNFYSHTGIDYTGVARAVYTNVLNYGHGKSLVGGSTITQQVVKNFLLTNEKSLESKIKEAVLALRITKVYSKDRILELYLNEIYLGLRSYGVAAAALNYFNKPLEELSIEEAALLAAMPKAPASYDPRRNYQAAKQRRDWVLSRMQEDGYITDAEQKAAAALPIMLRTRDAEEVADADFFAEEVRRWLAQQYGANVLYEGGLVVKTTLNHKLQQIADNALRAALTDYDRRRGYRGPIKRLGSLDNWKQKLTTLTKEDNHLIDGQRIGVVTSMDAQKFTVNFEDDKTAIVPFSLMKWTRRVIADGVLGAEVRRPADILALGDVVIVAPASEEQKKTLPEADRKIAWDLQQVPAVNGAFIAMDPHNGRVLALSGGYTHGSTEFDRATQAKRQPGSSFKPFVYMAGLENGFTPSTMILDAPVEMSQGAGLPTWKPANYKDEYLGPTTMRQGLEKSRNTMTVRLAQTIGIDKVIEMGKRLGVYDNPAANFSLVLGAGETTLLRMASAYCSIANGGKRVIPSLIERIDDRHGRTIYRRDTRPCNNCLVEDPSAIAKNAEPPIPPDDRERVIDERIAYQMTSMLEGVVQRGTATKARALNRPLAGKTGTTNNSMDTWFVGFSPDLVAGVYIGYDRPQTLGKKETGGSVALPAFVRFMGDALAKEPAKPFRIPPGIQLVKVDLRSGLPADEVPESTRVIQEAFLTGEPIFLPESALALRTSAPQEEVEVTLAPEENNAPRVDEDLPWLRPSAAPPRDIYMQQVPAYRSREQDAYEQRRREHYPPRGHENHEIIGRPDTPSQGTGGLY